jgi:DNA-binding CsgD family transcriptional regulator
LTPTCPCCTKPLAIREDRLKLIESPFKRRIATMAAQGMTQKEIATALGVKPHNVCVQMGHVRDSLRVSNQREMTLYLYGLIEYGGIA